MLTLHPRADGKLLPGGFLWLWGDSAGCALQRVNPSWDSLQRELEKTCSYALNSKKNLLSSINKCAGVRLTQCKLEDLKIMPNFETNYDHFNFLKPVSTLKETTETTKESPNLLVEVQAKMYYSLKTMARKFRKYGQVENIMIHLQNTPTHCLKYKKEEESKNL